MKKIMEIKIKQLTKEYSPCHEICSFQLSENIIFMFKKKNQKKKIIPKNR